MQAVSGRRDGVATAVFVSSGTIQIHVGAGSDAATADVLLVGYLREATTPIGRGENSGRTLKESNVVLSLHELGRWNGGGTTDSVTARHRTVSSSKKQLKRIVPSEVDFPNCDDNAINNSLFRSLSHAQQT
jgi:hypothetical protein